MPQDDRLPAGEPPQPAAARAPFGGFRQSGKRREWGVHGIEEFLEMKAIMGYAA